MPIELPVLRLGLAGFAADEQRRFAEILREPSAGGIAWQIDKFQDADAVWINSSRTRALADGNLRIASGISSGRAINFDPRQPDRPVAFSTPTGAWTFEPMLCVDTGSTASIQAILAQFEASLQLVAAQFCIASYIVENENVLGSGIYHLSAEGRLLAVVDFQGDVGVRPGALAASFEGAAWMRQLASADTIPQSFARAGLTELMWQYATRTSRDVLPRRYRTGPIYYRRLPRLPPHVVPGESHLALLRDLESAPMSFNDLLRSSALDSRQLAHELAALYVVGTITSKLKRAASGRAGDHPWAGARSGQSVNPGMLPSDLGPDAVLR